VRSHIPLIGIAVAALLAVVIIAAGSRLPRTAGTPLASSTEPAGHPAMSEQIGMVDAAVLERQIRALERAYSANPTSLRIALNLGDAYYSAQRLDEAGRCYRAALRRHPGHPSAIVRLAMVWHAQGADARAVKAIQEVVRGLPDNQEAHYDLALIYFHLQDVRAARTEWVASARIDPGSQLGQASQTFVDLLATEAQSPAPAP
jgi:cytochrome c-type biogenesis protein CcmH/NrfG